MIQISDCYLYRNGETYALQLATSKAREAFPEFLDYRLVEEPSLEELLKMCDKFGLTVRYFV
jgi:hypothetical protein